jgi:SulP family sulfate permease
MPEPQPPETGTSEAVATVIEDSQGPDVGTSPLRQVIAMAQRVGPKRATFRDDAVAGVVTTVGCVPDGMAAAVLAGVNPIHGLYASAAGPIVGGLLVASPLILVTTTSAAALSAGAAVGGQAADVRAEAIFLLVIITGLIQIAAGVLRLGRFTRFVSHSVMVGFLTGVASLMVLGQFGSITGTDPQGSTSLAKAVDMITHPSLIDPISLLIGIAAIGIVLAPIRGPLRRIAPLIAIALPAAAVVALGLDGVQIVSDVGDILSGLPIPTIPSLDLLTIELVTGALAVAAVIMVQGAGVAESFPPSGGRLTRPSRDFVAQGAANVVSGALRGIPVGASVGQTALSVSAGARSRWAAVLAGLFMLLVLAVFAPVVELVPMPALAGLLIVAGVRTINLAEASAIWRTGIVSRIAIVATFVATLFLPIQAAVATGVLLSTLLYLNQASMDVVVTQLVELPDGRVEERPPEPRLGSGRPTVLDIHGSMFYAGAQTLARLLPAPEGAVRPVVVLRIRGRTKVGATFIKIVDRYAGRLAAVGGRLYLSGVDEHVRDQLVRSGKLDLGGDVRLEEVTPVIGESTRRAIGKAEAWLSAPVDGKPDDGD